VVGMKQVTIEEIRNSVVPYGKDFDLARIVLFGSYARHDENESSDIDLLIDAECSDFTLFDLSGMRLDLKEKFGRKVDIVTLAGLDEKVRRNVMEDQIILYEREKSKH
jgi:predicted nucleotidyltransferase